MRRRLLGTALLSSLALAACSGEPPPEPTPTPAPPADMTDVVEPMDAAPVDENAARLAAVLAAQPEEVQARYRFRNPAETLAFFGIEPGMTVVEVLPSGGWYSRILLPYLGDTGRLIGVDYSMAMYPLFGFMSEEQVAAKATWAEEWIETANGWRHEEDASVDAFVFGALPEEMRGTADAVVMIRALHNLGRFDAVGGFLGEAVQDLYDVLRPGGILGVVQHEARPEMPDEWADGSAGYLKKQFVIDTMTAAGFEFIDSSDVNQNPLDRPTTDDIVWRLPPNLLTSRDDPELREQLIATGESNRMTLKFRKPGE